MTVHIWQLTRFDYTFLRYKFNKSLLFELAPYHHILLLACSLNVLTWK